MLKIWLQKYKINNKYKINIINIKNNNNKKVKIKILNKNQF
jgi:hypothetical protein